MTLGSMLGLSELGQWRAISDACGQLLAYPTDGIVWRTDRLIGSLRSFGSGGLVAAPLQRWSLNLCDSATDKLERRAVLARMDAEIARIETVESKGGPVAVVCAEILPALRDRRAAWRLLLPCF